MYIHDFPLNNQDAELVLVVDDINILITDKKVYAVQVMLNWLIKQFETQFLNNSLIGLLIKQRQCYFT